MKKRNLIAFVVFIITAGIILLHLAVPEQKEARQSNESNHILPHVTVQQEFLPHVFIL
jgi:hypothetical protein